MQIGFFKKDRHDAKFGAQLERRTQFESRGLGITRRGAKQKASTSNHCSLYILKNGATLYQFGDRFAIVAATECELTDTAKLLKIKAAEIEVVDSDDPDHSQD